MIARRRRRQGIAVLTLAAAVLVWQAGHLIDHTDPLRPVDAIFVLGGSRLERALEARDLYAAHVAPTIVISPGGHEHADAVLERQNIHVPSEGEFARDVLVSQLGVPASAIDVLPDSVDNTAQETAAIHPLVIARRWTSLIVISDCASTRRAAYAARRELGAGVTIVARCSRYDTYDAAHWWRTRSDIRQTYFELPKLLAYWSGLGG